MGNKKNVKVEETKTSVELKNEKKMEKTVKFQESMANEIEGTLKATASQLFVNKLFKGFLNIPTKVDVKFKNVEKKLQMIVSMTHKNKITQVHKSFADFALVEDVVAAMGMKIGYLEHYKADEHEVKSTEEDLRVELFRQFLQSPYRCYFGDDFVAKNGDRYLCATFTVNYEKTVSFCLKRTEEMENIIDTACSPAA